MQSFVGWRIVGVAFLTQAVAVGFTMGTFTLFVRPVEEAFGATRASVTLGVSIVIVVMGLSMPFIGRALDRSSARNIMLLGAVLNTGSLMLMSAASELWQMAVLCVGVGLGVAMLGPVASSTVVANWFEQQRGRALGIANMGAPAGPLLVAPVAALAMEAIGWRATLLAYAVATFLLAVPAVYLVIVNRPSDVGQQPDGREPPQEEFDAGAGHALAGGEWTLLTLFASRDFWAMAITVGIVLAAPIVLSAHLEPYCATLGVGRQAASLLIFLTSLMAIVGTLAFGVLADRLDLRRLLWSAIALQVGLWMALLTTPQYGTLLLLFALFGLCAGATMPIYGSIIARSFGPAAFGQVMGTAGLLMLPLHFAAPPLAGALYDRTGDYSAAIEAVIVSLLVAALTLGFLRPARAPEARAA